MSKQLGVKYIYESGAPKAQAEDVNLTTEMQAILPSDLRQELRSVVESLDSERIAATLKKISTVDPELGFTLSRLTDNYDYPTILRSRRGLQAMAHPLSRAATPSWAILVAPNLLIFNDRPS
jgi:hypothetical protein